MDVKMNRCIESCAECSKTCMKMVVPCLEKGGKHAEPTHIRLLLDCAEICKLATSFMARGSDFENQLCALCAEISDKCAKRCEKLADHEDMKHCAEVWRKGA